MKRLLVILILVAFAGAVAFASLNSMDKKQGQVKKIEKKEIKKKKECKRTCWLSS
ncbi:MAG: hypothetical protein H7122_03525 [Chitinophagaceae bacterium]|nr:hypothetical protein [Chitinophagaceae bacterium]